MKRTALTLSIVTLTLILIGAVIVANETTAPSQNSPAPFTPHSPSVVEQQNFNKKQFSLEDPASLWVVVNKKRPVPANYVPTDLRSSQLRSEAFESAQKLIAAAKIDNVPLKIISGYRSYATQKSVYESFVQKDGQAAADNYSARPGHSEHQTGLAVDLGNVSGKCDLDACFGQTAGGEWLANNASEYGYIIRYEKDTTTQTGYQYEPWHIRYVGAELAEKLKDSGNTMEAFFDLPATPGY